MKTGYIDSRIDHIGVMRAFVQIVEAGCFSAAARELHVSISTLTRKITAIEDALGVKLLHRSTHSMALTEAGTIYYHRAITLISDMDDTLRAVSEINAHPSGPIKLTAPVTFGRRYLSPLVAPFLKLYPKIQLDVRLTDNHNDLVTGGFDLDIHEGENYLDNLVVQKLSRNDCILCATPSYLERYGRPSEPSHLLNHNCLIYAHPEGDPHWHFETDKTKCSIKPSGNLVSDNTELLLDATRSGLGVSDFEIWLVRDLLASGELEVVLPECRMKNKLTGSYIYMAYLPNRRNSAKLKALRDFISDHLSHIGTFSNDELIKYGCLI